MARSSASVRILGVIDRGNLRTLLLVAGALVGRPTPESALAGSILVLAGGALHLWAKGCLTQDRDLTTGGPYRWTRNPFYLANLAIDAGLCVVANRLALALAFLAAWLVLYADAIRREERVIEGLFGDAYRRYAARVPRFLPRRRPLPRAEAGPGFSWRSRNLVEGTEYARLARILAAPLWILLPRALLEAAGRGFAHAEGALAGALALASLLLLDKALVRAARARVSRRGTPAA
jgi:hypothetical protein